MSFAGDIKNELCRIAPDSKCCKSALLCGIICFGGRIKEHELIISSRSFGVIQLASSIIRSLLPNAPRAVKSQSGETHRLTLPSPGGLLEMLGMEEAFLRPVRNLIVRDCCKGAFARGAFLGGGTATDPTVAYRLELVTIHYPACKPTQDILTRFDIRLKLAKRAGRFLLYTSAGEQISDFLALVGAHNCAMSFLNSKIIAESRGNANRIVNFETANIEKQINASMRQLEAIEKIELHYGLDRLPEELESLCLIRLQNHDASLSELGEMSEPPLSKSAVNRLFERIIKISREISE